MKYKIKYKTYQFEVREDYQDFIKTPDKVIDLLKEDFTPIQEKMILLGMNIKNKVILKKDIAIGGNNTLLITPKEIFSYLFKSDCRNFILAHNHPSNDTEPSKEDVTFTRKLQKACEYVGFNFLDHIIFTADDYYSFKKNNLI